MNNLVRSAGQPVDLLLFGPGEQHLMATAKVAGCHSNAEDEASESCHPGLTVGVAEERHRREVQQIDGEFWVPTGA